MKVAVIKYNAGNIKSVILCLKRLGIEPIISDGAEELNGADKIIFPGVGEANTTMSYLREKKLDKIIPTFKQPVLGICLGMQLMCSYSEEGNTACLGIFNEKVKRFHFEDNILKIPHIGWNNLQGNTRPLFNGVPKNDFVYFVHSYYVESGPDTIAKTDYGIEFSSAINKNNFYGVQFHPEKSAKAGERIISNFLSI